MGKTMRYFRRETQDGLAWCGEQVKPREGGRGKSLHPVEGGWSDIGSRDIYQGIIKDGPRIDMVCET